MRTTAVHNSRSLIRAAYVAVPHTRVCLGVSRRVFFSLPPLPPHFFFFCDGMCLLYFIRAVASSPVLFLFFFLRYSPSMAEWQVHFSNVEKDRQTSS